ncbi:MULTISPECIES: hypothetical protein [Oceanobacillus]|uniref:DUF1440 domain-containing protein n=1 Tax=Oceanobacillus profundus TaxID=372463 RepID=A0A417YNH8_9BACI|nr:hypothetical protein [Oceanobacillus profundus]MCM3398769.1 hypothetical protein [Oceanobacillus profundus]RHW35374.1 hypothetical protein D1B32_01775 [Oceanobacillus profundus]
MKRLCNLISSGIISGLVLGIFLKMVELFTGKAVYVLLLNVDYIPIIKEWNMHEAIEFGLHLIVSIILVLCIYFLLERWKLQNQMLPYIIVNVLIGCILYFTTQLSERTPDLMDRTAFLFWAVGHLIYGVVVWLLIQLLLREKER